MTFLNIFFKHSHFKMDEAFRLTFLRNIHFVRTSLNHQFFSKHLMIQKLWKWKRFLKDWSCFSGVVYKYFFGTIHTTT